MDARVGDMGTTLRGGRPFVRPDTQEGTDVFYQVLNLGGQFIARWEIDVQVGQSDRKELVRYKAFPNHSEAVDYLIEHRDDPLEHRQFLLDT